MNELFRVGLIIGWIHEHTDDLISFRACLRWALEYLDGKCAHPYERKGKCDLCEMVTSLDTD